MDHDIGGAGGNQAGTSLQSTRKDLPAWGNKRAVATGSLASTWLASRVTRDITDGANKPCNVVES